ncbi:MAG: phosphatase PAP2 family protein [Nitrospirae bacterium]|nr:phosphatase PAP2 family protein [Nitrospirota bacterium]
MNRLYSVAILAIFVLHAATAAADSRSRLQAAGDIITDLLPLAALGTAYFKGDSDGGKQWLRDTVLHEVLYTGLVLGFNETSLGKRPNGGPYSFPSGHAGFVFAQAGFLQERYGWRYGAPALLLAATVSYIRVDIRKHHWRDVIAGGALGYGCAWLTVTPLNAIHLAPIIGPDWLGIRYERSF